MSPVKLCWLYLGMQRMPQRAIKHEHHDPVLQQARSFHTLQFVHDIIWLKHCRGCTEHGSWRWTDSCVCQSD